MAQQATYITGATVLAGEELQPVEDAVIRIGDETIEALGTGSEVAVPAGAEQVRASGTTIVPGFIDAHVHIGLHRPHDVLSGGVTTVRDLGWPPEIIFPLARQSARPDFDGPEILSAGPMLTVAGGYPTRARWAPEGTGLVVSSPGDAADTIAHLAAEKAAIVKVALNPEVGPVFDTDTLKGIVKEAHVSGLRVTGHVSGLRELEKALAAGMDELAHMLMGPDLIPQDLLEEMVSRNMTVVPTLAIRSGRERRAAIENLERFIAAGGSVVYGTDLGNSGVAPGIDRTEIKLMAKAGMAPLEILGSATVAAARWLGLEDRGVISAGKRADLVGLAGIDGAAQLSSVKMVWRGGNRVR